MRTQQGPAYTAGVRALLAAVGGSRVEPRAGFSRPGGRMPELTGGVRLANGLPASGLRFQLQREVFGGEPEVVAEVTTDESGNFSTPDLDVDEQTSLVARVV